ncbi:hypothetical protein A3715_15115 [Oleiphilus sp. HI0009]|uniref:Do family serine endopeptidase n=1 Tax=Oleiphilus sp. HI0125 TaxID=1822266 RepID=UPI0007C23808|nr:Do family serine endopeptidase [Oleiphilus sp. HI0125]KZX74842.1 hypothetical protein A3715_15115 [Oleiphilus sp. HI0009]KZZ57300.1 hypothetical protein A3762_01375 [Oleiphilus sp. HI0125]
MFSKPFISKLIIVNLLMLSTSTFASVPERIISGSSVPSLSPIVENAAPAVVNIATFTIRQQRTNPLLNSPFFRHFFQLPDQPGQTRRTQSAGSGVIVDAENGFILTNHHVIENADEIKVTLQDGRTLTATLLGSDEKVDLAALKIEAKNLRHIPFAQANSSAVGDFVLAIGSPFGLQQTVTSGIISALGRSGLGLQGYEDFIQTDASINPGNSGGALINLRGELIGINSAILAPAGGNVGIGFAIPSVVAQSILKQLILYGEVKRGGIGASFQDLTADLAEAFGLNLYQGALVSEVKTDSAAERAGLVQGDVVIEANERPVKNAEDMRNQIGLAPLGETLKLKLLRGERTLELAVETEEIPIPEIKGVQLHPSLSGLQLQDLINPDKERSVGVMVMNIEERSTAAFQGFEIGDIIYGVNNKRIHSIEELSYFITINAPQSYHIRRHYQDFVIYTR